MDVFPELLQPSNRVRTESTAKDRKQNSKGKYKNKQNYLRDSSAESVTGSQIRKISNWDDVERRSGKDRREFMECRGRWLESRDEKDRRQIAKAIKFKV